MGSSNTAKICDMEGGSELVLNSQLSSFIKKLTLLLHHRQARPWLLIHSACEELITALKQHLQPWYGRCRLRDKQPEHISEYTCNLENHGIIHPLVSCPSAEHAGMLEKLRHVVPEPGHKWAVPPGRCLLEIQAIGKVFLGSLWQTMKFDIVLNTERGICYSDVRENVQDWVDDHEAEPGTNTRRIFMA